MKSAVVASLLSLAAATGYSGHDPSGNVQLIHIDFHTVLSTHYYSVDVDANGNKLPLNKNNNDEDGVTEIFFGDLKGYDVQKYCNFEVDAGSAISADNSGSRFFLRVVPPSVVKSVACRPADEPQIDPTGSPDDAC